MSTDSAEIAEIALAYGASVPSLRPAELAGPLSRDIEWVQQVLSSVDGNAEAFALLRPTSPLRRPESVRRAVEELLGDPGADSLRAVELCSQHPGKMWLVKGDRMSPLLSQPSDGQPWHSTPYQGLPPVHVQNAALEVAWTRTVERTGTIAGSTIRPFVLDGYEGQDINETRDWWAVERLLHEGLVQLPSPAPSDDPLPGSAP